MPSRPITPCGKVRRHAEQHSKVLRKIQAYEEMFEWLEEEYNLASAAVDELRASTTALQALQPQPTLDIAKKNISHMHAELHMTKSQACLFRRLCCNCTLQHRVRHVPKGLRSVTSRNPAHGWSMPGPGVKGLEATHPH